MLLPGETPVHVQPKRAGQGCNLRINGGTGGFSGLVGGVEAIFLKGVEGAEVHV